VDAVEPLGVLGLHEDGAEGGDGRFVAPDGGGETCCEEGGGEFGEGEVEILGGGGFEDAAGVCAVVGEQRSASVAAVSREWADVEYGGVSEGVWVSEGGSDGEGGRLQDLVK